MIIHIHAGKDAIQADFPKIAILDFENFEDAQYEAQKIIRCAMGDTSYVSRTIWMENNQFTDESKQLFVYLSQDSYHDLKVNSSWPIGNDDYNSFHAKEKEEREKQAVEMDKLKRHLK